MVPGFLLAFHLVLLVAFLNPRLPLAGESMVHLLARILGITTVCSFLVGALLARGGWPSIARALPWLISAELALVALVYGSHAWALGYGIYPGVARRLVKAAISLGVLSLIAFYTALLHSLTRRVYGLRSQGLFLGIALVSLWVSVERRETLRLPVVVDPPLNAIARTQERLVVVWLEGAGLELLLPLAERGELPFLANAFRDGAFAAVEVLRPRERFPQTAAAATGKYPFRSGMVSRYVWRLPSSLEQIDLAPRPPAVPWLAPFGFERSPRPNTGLPFWEVWRSLAPDATLELGFEDSDGVSSPGALTAEELWRRDREVQREWQDSGLAPSALTLIRMRGLETNSSTSLAAPHNDLGASPVAGTTTPSVLRHLRWLDAALARHWAQRRDNENLIVFSASSPSGAHQKSPVWVSPESSIDDGLVLLLGPAVQRGHIARSIRPVDLAPTILYISGFPSARDLDGRVRTDLLSEAWLREHPLAFVPSYDFLARRSR